MCGIIGYTGGNHALDVLINGLEKLEYRGYDSAGVAVLNNDNIDCIKSKGKLENLKKLLIKNPLEGKTGIGHTRWATHGAPDYLNSHPHLSNDGIFAVVHNGIIENYKDIKDFLIDKGFSFKSQTDTEVIPNLISYYYKGDFFDAVQKAVSKLKGSFALCILCRESRDMVAAKKDSPLVIGLKNEEAFVASDIHAIAEYTNNMYFLKDDEYAILNKGTINIYNRNKEKISIVLQKTDADALQAQKGKYPHFMLKEIYEQPQAVENALYNRITKNTPVCFDGLDTEFAKIVKKIHIVACGTAYNAGLTGKSAIEALAKIPVEVDIASEFRYRNPIINENTLITVISQSGETADTLAALRLAKEKGAKVLAITNVQGSTIHREADFVYLTHAGPEIAVASTKAYTTQLISMYNIALFFAQVKCTLSHNELEQYKKSLLEIPLKMEQILGNTQCIQDISKKLACSDNIIFMGRGIDWASVTEGALKLKEITYIHSHAYAAGELKHGPIALIDDSTTVVCLCTQNSLYTKTQSNVKEVKARGATVIGILNSGMPDDGYNSSIFIPECMPLLTPLIAALPLQLVAYYTATNKGFDPDKPRNLAKSVTVE